MTRRCWMQAEALAGRCAAQMDRQALNEALEEVWKVIRAANAYIDRQAPWALKKTDEVRMEAVLRVLADVIRHRRDAAAAVHARAAWRRCWTSLACRRGARALPALERTAGRGNGAAGAAGVFPRYVEEAGVKHVMLIDSHCHLDYFPGEERAAVAGAGAGGRRGGDGDHRHAAVPRRRADRHGERGVHGIWCTVGHASASRGGGGIA